MLIYYSLLLAHYKTRREDILSPLSLLLCCIHRFLILLLLGWPITTRLFQLTLSTHMFSSTVQQLPFFPYIKKRIIVCRTFYNNNMLYESPPRSGNHEIAAHRGNILQSAAHASTDFACLNFIPRSRTLEWWCSWKMEDGRDDMIVMIDYALELCEMGIWEWYLGVLNRFEARVFDLLQHHRIL